MPRVAVAALPRGRISLCNPTRRLGESTRPAGPRTLHLASGATRPLAGQPETESHPGTWPICSGGGAIRPCQWPSGHVEECPTRGVLATKVGYFGVKSTNVLREQIRSRWAPNLLNSVACSRLASTLLNYVGSAQRRPPPSPPLPRSSLRERTRPKLLKWGFAVGLGRLSNLLKPDRPLTSTTPPCTA